MGLVAFSSFIYVLMLLSSKLSRYITRNTDVCTVHLTTSYVTRICAAVDVSSAEHVLSDLVGAVTQRLTHSVGKNGHQGLLQGISGFPLLRDPAPSRGNTQLSHVVCVCCMGGRLLGMVVHGRCLWVKDK